MNINTATIICLAALLVSCAQQTPIKEKRAKDSRPSPEALFKIKDTNKDGYLTYNEFKLQSKKRADHSTTTQKAPTEEMRQKRFAMIDTNSDQRISLPEMKAMPPKPQRPNR